MFCGFRAFWRVCEQLIHECTRCRVLGAAPEGEECGGEDVADIFRGGDKLCGAWAFQGYFSSLYGIQRFVDCALDSGFLDQAPMNFGGCSFVNPGFPLLDVVGKGVHGRRVSLVTGGGRELGDVLSFLIRAGEVGWDGTLIVW